VKKSSKQERREAKAEANRIRAAEAPSRRRKRQAPPREPLPPPPTTSQRSPVASKYRPRSATFEIFEREFASFEQALEGDSGARFDVKDVPRPPVSDVMGAARVANEREWRAAWRRGLLLWHPDKWSSRAVGADDASLVLELAQAMTRAVLREKEAGWFMNRL